MTLTKAARVTASLLLVAGGAVALCGLFIVTLLYAFYAFILLNGPGIAAFFLSVFALVGGTLVFSRALLPLLRREWARE